MTTLCEIIVAQLIMFHRRAQGHTSYQATAETLERGTGSSGGCPSQFRLIVGRVTDLGSLVACRDEELQCKKPES